SIDEAFLDITTTHHLFGGPEAIGSSIKSEVKKRFGINCTIGIAPNILLAKLASDIAKPDGLRWIKPEDIPFLLENMPVNEMWGVGSRITARLEELSIRTCGELGRASASLLRSKFGIIGESLKGMGMGLCNRPLIVHQEDPKSIGHSMTLPGNISDRKEIEAYILKLSEMVGRRARRYGFTGKRVTLTIRYPDFETFSKQAMLYDHTNHTHEIYKNAISILNSIRLRDSVRLLGVSLSDLIRESNQMQLFEDRRKEKALLQAMDSINDRYGDFKLIWASYLKQAEPPKVIAPAWRPSGVRSIDVRK
ncbi:MAG: DNA polymerase IV, partial [Nitrospirota bacterium]